MVESAAEKEIEEDTWDGSVRTLKKFIDYGINKKIVQIAEEQTRNSKNMQDL